MSFLDRLQNKKVDPMAEVSATAVAHLREQNLKFQKYMYEKLQELEESFSMEQRRLSEMEPEPAAGDFDGDEFAGGADEFSDYGIVEDDEPAVDNTARVSLEDGVPLEEADWTADASPPPPMPDDEVPVLAEEVSPSPELAAADPEPQPWEVPENEDPPGWENLLGLAGAPAATEGELMPDEAVSEADSQPPEPVFEQAEEETVEPDTSGAEVETTQETPEAAALLPVEPGMNEEETVDSATAEEPEVATMLIAVEQPPVSATGEAVEARDESPGSSLLWDWRSPAGEENTGEKTGQSAAFSMFDPAWEAAGQTSGVLVDEKEIPDSEETAFDEEDFNLLADEEERELSPDMPLPDELNEFE